MQGRGDAYAMGCVMFELEKTPGRSNGYWCLARCFDKLSMTDRGEVHEGRRRGRLGQPALPTTGGRGGPTLPPVSTKRSQL
jgi:hypothetical protein